MCLDISNKRDLSITFSISSIPEPDFIKVPDFNLAPVSTITSLRIPVYVESTTLISPPIKTQSLSNDSPACTFMKSSFSSNAAS